MSEYEDQLQEHQACTVEQPCEKCIADMTSVCPICGEDVHTDAELEYCLSQIGTWPTNLWELDHADFEAVALTLMELMVGAPIQQCELHGFVTVTAQGSGRGFAGPIYWANFSCGCQFFDGSADNAEAAR